MLPGDYDWRRIRGDKARRYERVIDGVRETISRRQYDEKFGRLAAWGLTNESQAKKNKAENPAMAAMRPARGRRLPPRNEQFARGLLDNRRPHALPSNKNFFSVYSIPFGIGPYLEMIATMRRINGILYVSISVAEGDGNGYGAIPYWRWPWDDNQVVQFWNEILEICGGQSGRELDPQRLVFTVGFKACEITKAMQRNIDIREKAAARRTREKEKEKSKAKKKRK